ATGAGLAGRRGQVDSRGWPGSTDPGLCRYMKEVLAAMFPTTRLRRLRYQPLVRAMVRESTLDARDFILPLFVRHGQGVKKEITSMPGNYQLSVDRLVEEVGEA